jgi:hypothetical protein
MISKENTELINKFNNFINTQNIIGMQKLMTVDHIFIDSENNIVRSKENCLKAWDKFFKLFPDYKNVFVTMMEKGSSIIIEGYSTCSEVKLNGKAIWSTKIINNKIAEWRVYEDSPDNRKKLNLGY